MNKIIVLFLIVLLGRTEMSAQWKPVGDRIQTQWAANVEVDNVLPEYPRPIMERKEWMNLNGLWDYAVVPLGNSFPLNYDGQILVPFAIESSLSGVGKLLDYDSALWYQRHFEIPSDWKGKRILLHFGAVDWKTDVWVNGIKVGTHIGGFTPFSFDVTATLRRGSNRVTVKVWDPTDLGYQPRGKQSLNPHGIWYTPVSGIWQTVWLEPVSQQFISSIRIMPDIDRNLLSFDVSTNTPQEVDRLEAVISTGGEQVAFGAALPGVPIEVAMPIDVQLWSPDHPFLYDVEISLYAHGRLVDCVKSYAAMRKYSTRRDADGIMRLQLNNRDLFQFGPLDQGWWPDGLYTAPTDEAMLYDLRKTKDFGFNMIRKHVKVEPARWYTYCDRLGIIVWQDMPNGDRSPEWQSTQYFDGRDVTRTAESEANYRREWKDIIDCLYSYPCIGVWVPFNEAWGQFKTTEIVAWTKQYDPSRLVNPASGGNHYACGDLLDLHNYPAPKLYLYDAQRPTVLGEYGGIGLAVEGHTWETKRNWGYVQFKNSEEATVEYIKYARQLLNLSKHGFSAAVYTQTTDVEVEINGLMTYDRKVVKLNETEIRKINEKIIHSLDKK